MAVPLTNPVNDVPVLGPIAVAFSNIGSTSREVLAADIVRRGIIFYNPGTETIRVGPSGMTIAVGAGGIPIYSGNELPIYAEGLLNLNAAWYAVADSGEANGLSILNFTDNNQSVPAPEPQAYLNYKPTISSPVGTTASLSTASTSVIAASSVRRGVAFVNSSDVDIWVCPDNLSAVAGAGSFRVFPGGTREFIAKGRLRVNCGWNARAASGSGKILSILDYR